jgi:O-antigen/teichoic acid export membrane protein
MLKQKLNPSLVLALGYAIGQGSIFVLQLTARYLGLFEVAGLIVLLVSVISFCFQFSDMGNSTYLVKNIIEKQTNQVSQFIYSRAVLGLLICILFSIVGWYQYPKPSLIAMYLVLPLIGAFCALFQTSYLEASQNYLKMAICNCLPWLVMCIAMLAFFTPADMTLAVAIVSLSVLVCCFCVCRYCWFFKKSDFEFKSILIASAFVFPPLGGQVLFRYILFSLASTASLAELGALGTVRYGQVGSILILSFIIRPLIRDCINDFSSGSADISFATLIKKYKFALILSVSISIVCIVVYLINLNHAENRAGLVYWLPVLFMLPLVVCAQAATQTNQLILKPSLQLFIEYLGLAVNLIAFVVLVMINPVVAIVVGEVLYAITIVISAVLIGKIKK